MKSKKLISVLLVVIMLTSVFVFKSDVRAISICVYASDIANDPSYNYSSGYLFYNLTENTVLYMDQSIKIYNLNGNNYNLTIKGEGTLTVENLHDVKNYYQESGSSVYVSSNLAKISVTGDMFIETDAYLKFEEFSIESSSPVNIDVGGTFTSSGSVSIKTYAWNGINAKNVIINGGELYINSRLKSCISATESISFYGGNVELKFNTYEDRDANGTIIFSPQIKVASGSKISTPQNYVFKEMLKTDTVNGTSLIGKTICESDNSDAKRLVIERSPSSPAVDSNDSSSGSENTSGGTDTGNTYNIMVVPDAEEYTIQLGNTIKVNYYISFTNTNRIKIVLNLYDQNGTSIGDNFKTAFSSGTSYTFSKYISKYKNSAGVYQLVTKIYYYENKEYKYLGEAPVVTINVTDPDSSSGGSSSGGYSSGSSSSGSSRRTGSFANEWVDGKWYNANGTQTYGPTLSWKYNGSGWWVEDSSGWYPTSKWQKIDGYWYYFNASGYMASGEWVDGWWCNNDGSCTYGGVGSWNYGSGGWWYGDSTGWYASNTWQKIDGYWYYFKGDGYMATNQYVDGYWVGADGVCR